MKKLKNVLVEVGSKKFLAVVVSMFFVASIGIPVFAENNSFNNNGTPNMGVYQNGDQLIPGGTVGNGLIEIPAGEHEVVGMQGDDLIIDDGSDNGVNISVKVSQETLAMYKSFVNNKENADAKFLITFSSTDSTELESIGTANNLRRVDGESVQVTITGFTINNNSNAVSLQLEPSSNLDTSTLPEGTQIVDQSGSTLPNTGEAHLTAPMGMQNIQNDMRDFYDEIANPGATVNYNSKQGFVSVTFGDYKLNIDVKGMSKKDREKLMNNIKNALKKKDDKKLEKLLKGKNVTFLKGKKGKNFKEQFKQKVWKDEKGNIHTSVSKTTRKDGVVIKTTYQTVTDSSGNIIETRRTMMTSQKDKAGNTIKSTNTVITGRDGKRTEITQDLKIDKQGKVTGTKAVIKNGKETTYDITGTRNKIEKNGETIVSYDLTYKNNETGKQTQIKTERVYQDGYCTSYKRWKDDNLVKVEVNGALRYEQKSRNGIFYTDGTDMVTGSIGISADQFKDKNAKQRQKLIEDTANEFKIDLNF